MSAVRTQTIEELRHMVLVALGEHSAEVWLFGSCARGDALQHSDIDIAILPHGALPPDLSADLSEAIETGPSPYDVDLVDLRRAAPSLIEEIRREGVKWKG